MKTRLLVKSLLVVSVFTVLGVTTVAAMAGYNMDEKNVLPPPGPYMSLTDRSQLNAPNRNMPSSSFNRQSRTTNVPVWQRNARAPHQIQQQANIRPDWRARPPEPQWRHTPPPRSEWVQRVPQAPYWNSPARPYRNNQVPADPASQKNTDVDGNANANNNPQYRTVQRRPDWAMQRPTPPQWRNRPPRPEWAQRPPQMRGWNPSMRPPMRPQWNNPAPSADTATDSVINDQASQKNSNVDGNRVPQYGSVPQRADWAVQSRVPYQWSHRPPPRPGWAQNQPQSEEPSAEQVLPQAGTVNRYAIPDARGRVYGPGYGYPPVR